MGFFSWHTQDTHRSIANTASPIPTFRVVMLDGNGNQWIEDEYEGYGKFGGKDYYELLAEMNGLTTREDGIELEFHPEGFGMDPKNILYPNLVEDASNWKYTPTKPENCEYQGYFYPDADEHGYDDDDY
jgi:hypothetical protein